MSTPIVTPNEAFLIDSPEVQQEVVDKITKFTIWQEPDIVPYYEPRSIVWFSADLYVKKNDALNTAIAPEDNTDDWQHISYYVAELFELRYPNAMPTLQYNILQLVAEIYALQGSVNSLYQDNNANATQISLIKTIFTNYTDRHFVAENTANNEVLISNITFTSSNVCKIPSHTLGTGGIFQKWICYSNEADGGRLYIKEISSIGNGTRITSIKGKNPRMYNETELLYIATEGTYKDRIMKKSAFTLSDGLAWGNFSNKAYSFCVGWEGNLLISLMSTEINLDKRLHRLSTNGSMTQITSQAVDDIEYKHGYIFFSDSPLLNPGRLFKKSRNNSSLTGAIQISQDVLFCKNICNTIDNLLIYDAQGFIYAKRDLEVGDGVAICIPSGGRDYMLGCDLGGGEAIILKETSTEGEYLMYRKNMFIHV